MNKHLRKGEEEKVKINSFSYVFLKFYVLNITNSFRFAFFDEYAENISIESNDLVDSFGIIRDNISLLIKLKSGEKFRDKFIGEIRTKYSFVFFVRNNKKRELKKKSLNR